MCFRNLVNISGQLLDEDEYKVTKDKLVIVARNPGETKRAQRYDIIIMIKCVFFETNKNNSFAERLRVKIAMIHGEGTASQEKATMVCVIFL